MSFPRVMIADPKAGSHSDLRVDPDAAAGLRRLRRLSCSSRMLVRQLARLSRRTDRPLRVLDVGSGCGDLAIDWMCRARRQNIQLQVTVLERCDRDLNTCWQAARHVGLEIGIVQRDCLVDRLPTGFDVVTCSMLMHRLDEAQIVRLLHEMWRSCSQSVIVCDWERSQWNLGIVAATARIVSRNEQVRNEAAQCIRAALTREELSVLIQRSIGLAFPIYRSLPCQYIAFIDQSCEVQRVPELQPAISGAISG